MEIILAKKISELSNEELISLLMAIKKEDIDAFQLIQEKIQEII